MFAGIARKAGGYAVSHGPDGKKFECDTITCAHCSTVVHVPPKADPNTTYDFCRLCMKATCAVCGGKPCTPFLRKLEREEASYHARRSYGL